MKFDDLIETIDMLDAQQADEVIDWQLTDSPAAKVEGTDSGWVRVGAEGGRRRSWTTHVGFAATSTTGFALSVPERTTTPLVLDQDIYVLEPHPWPPEPLDDDQSCQLLRTPVTTVSFRRIAAVASSYHDMEYMGYAITWHSEARGNDGFSVGLIRLMLEDHDYVRELARREIYPGLEAVLSFHDGAVHGYLESFDPGGR